MTEKNLLVTVPIFNQPRWTRNIIEQLALKTHNWATFLFVDDGSSDPETLDALEKSRFRHDWFVVHNDGNRGVAYSWNRAIEFSKTLFQTMENWDKEKVLLHGFKHIAFLNNDIILPHYWDELLLEPLKKKDVFLSSFCDTDNYWHGYWFMVKSQLFDEIGNFTEEFGKYGGEDTDFMLRMKQQGYKWENVPTKDLDEIGHFGSASAVEIFKTPEDRWAYHDELQKKIWAKWEKVEQHK